MANHTSETTRRNIRFWFACKWDGIRSFFLMMKRLPGFYRLNRFWDCEPDFYGWVIRQYENVMYDMTGGKLSKPTHDAETVLQAAWEHIDDLWEREKTDGREETHGEE